MSRLFRVVHVVPRLDDEEAIEPLRQWARLFVPRGVEGQAVAWAGAPQAVAELASAGLAVQAWDRRWPWDPCIGVRLRRLLREPWDVVHPWGREALRAVQRRRPRGVGWQLAPVLAADEWGAGTRADGGRRLLQGVDALAVVADADPMPTGWRTADALPCAWLPPAAAPQPACDAAARERLLGSRGLSPAARGIAVGGPLVRRRRLDEAIWALALLRLVAPDVFLAFTGHGPDRTRLQRFARQVGESRSVVFASPFERPQPWLAACDLAWEFATTEFATAGGRSQVFYDARGWGKAVVEVAPRGARGAGHAALPLGERALLVRRTLALFERSQPEPGGPSADEPTAVSVEAAPRGPAGWQACYARLGWSPLGGA